MNWDPVEDRLLSREDGIYYSITGEVASVFVKMDELVGCAGCYRCDHTDKLTIVSTPSAIIPMYVQKCQYRTSFIAAPFLRLNTLSGEKCVTSDVDGRVGIEYGDLTYLLPRKPKNEKFKMVQMHVKYRLQAPRQKLIALMDKWGRVSTSINQWNMLAMLDGSDYHNYADYYDYDYSSDSDDEEYGVDVWRESTSIGVLAPGPQINGVKYDSDFNSCHLYTYMPTPGGDSEAFWGFLADQADSTASHDKTPLVRYTSLYLRGIEVQRVDDLSNIPT